MGYCRVLWDAVVVMICSHMQMHVGIKLGEQRGVGDDGGRESRAGGATAGKVLVVQGNSRSQRGSGAVHKGSAGPACHL